MRSISLDYTHSFIEDYELENIKEYVNIAHNMLHDKKDQVVSIQDGLIIQRNLI